MRGFTILVSIGFCSFLGGCAADDFDVLHVSEPATTFLPIADPKVMSFVADSDKTAGPCFIKKYMPAEYRIEPRGRKLIKEKKRFEITKEGDQVKYNLVRDPDVFVERRVLLHKDYYSLHGIPCPSDKSFGSVVEASLEPDLQNASPKNP